VTVRGTVTNTATGQPLQRALVRIYGSPERAALTDEEGKFEIHGIPAGLHTFGVIKPGFGAQMFLDGEGRNSAPTVRVASGMPDLSLSLSPNNAIFGHVSLSTGTSAQGIGITLIRKTVVDGRANWSEGEHHQTTPDGAFRFSGLADGTYLLLIQPESDSGFAVEPSCDANATAEISGYAAQFYPDAQESAAAARIVLAGGANAEANLILHPTKFHLVEAKLTGTPTGPDWEVTPTLLDRSGQDLDYPFHQEKNHSFCAYLPDGAYTLIASAQAEVRGPSTPGSEAADKILLGSLDFSVDGQPNRSLRLPLALGSPTPIHLRYEPAPPTPPKAAAPSVGGADKTAEAEDDETGPPFSLSASPVNSFAGQGNTDGGGNLDSQALQTADGAYELEPTSPGAYWISASAGQKGVCLGSVTSAGQSMARTPWVAGAGGAGPPIEAVLRTDCAKLTVHMPITLAAETPGEGTTLYVYLLPEFDSLQELSGTQLEQFGDREATLDDLTPGTYRVFAFRTPQSIEFRNPDALAQLGTGQKITLAPRADASLLLEGVSK